MMSDSSAVPPETSSDYSARSAYEDYTVGERYEDVRFSGAIGRYRRLAEVRAVRAILDAIPTGGEVLDCPCGTGRWWPELSVKASRILAADISKGMLRHARERAAHTQLEVDVIEADAEALVLPDKSVDWVFSFALTKHLPYPLQYRVLAEFGRVARSGVVCTFGLFNSFTYEIWRRRNLAGSFPVLPHQLDHLAAEAGLAVKTIRRCSSPIGTERLVLFTQEAKA